MRRTWELLAVALLLTGGCAMDDNSRGRHNADYQGVAIVTPASGQQYERHYRWTATDSTDPCAWRWQQSDTLGDLIAEVHADVPGGIQNVQLYRTSEYSGLAPVGEPFTPATTTFYVPYYHDYGNTSLPYGNRYRSEFCVRVLSGENTYWISPILSFDLVFVRDSLTAIPPPPPVLLSFSEAMYSWDGLGTNLIVTWCTQRPSATTRLSFWNSFDQSAFIDTVVAGNEASYDLRDYLPLTTYGLSLSDLSATTVSDTLWLETGLPAMPRDLRATIQLPAGDVSLGWNPYRNGDSLLVARRTATGDWETFFRYYTRYSGYVTGTIDTSVVPGVDYYYRVGVNFRTGNFWSPESLHVRIG